MFLNLFYVSRDVEFEKYVILGGIVSNLLC